MWRQYLPSHRLLVCTAREPVVEAWNVDRFARFLPARGHSSDSHNKHGEETMKIRLPVALAGLAISCALPTVAQQKDTADTRIAQQIRILAAKYDEAINKRDAAAVAALYAQDGVWVTHDGSFHGRQAIEKGYVQLDVKSWQIGSYITSVDRVVAVGNEVRSTGRWRCVHKNWSGAPGNADGHYSWVIVREGDTWKIRKNTASGSGGIL